jgi:triphosphoribosyl-dephospho-CoA synthase
MRGLETDRITWSVHIACLLEVSADKPGNVTWGKDFWDTRFVDFMASAIAIGPAFRQAAEKPVGEIVLQAVQDTRRLANTNTNLGMTLLLAPLAKAASRGSTPGLRAGTSQVLEALTVEDARLAFEAIRLANPTGLGHADAYDVRENQVDITLLEAMRLAQSRDSVAREYVTDYEITFEIGFATLRQLWDAGYPFGDAIVQTYLTILAQVPDTLIMRKRGRQVAEEVSQRAAEVLKLGGPFSSRGQEALAEFDIAIRDPKHRLNPGTTADLIAATLFTFLTEGNGLENFPVLLQRW